MRLRNHTPIYLSFTSTEQVDFEVLTQIINCFYLGIPWCHAHTDAQGRMGPYPSIIMDNCNNLGVVHHENKPHCSLSTTQTHADVLWVLKCCIVCQPFALKFLHIASQANDTKPWHLCTLKERINIKVDHLAKKALICVHVTGQYFDGCFPMEDFQIFIGNVKVTGPVKPSLDDHWGKKTSKCFLDCKGIVLSSEFEAVWWSGIKKAMSSYPKMFCIFVSKQVSGWCGPNSKRSLWDTSINNICPNCEKINETSKHLTRCFHEGCITLFRESTHNIVTCLDSAHTDPDLIAIIESYLLGQGSLTMESCTLPHSLYLRMSQSQDCLGCNSFVDGCISILLLDSIRPFLHQWSPQNSMEKWGITLIKALLSLTHKQWIFRNTDVHHKINGLMDAQHNDILAWIRILVNTTPSDLLPCHRHLLDKKFRNLGNSETIQWQLRIASME